MPIYAQNTGSAGVASHVIEVESGEDMLRVNAGSSGNGITGDGGDGYSGGGGGGRSAGGKDHLEYVTFKP